MKWQKQNSRARYGHSIKGKGSHVLLRNNGSNLYVIKMFKENSKTEFK